MRVMDLMLLPPPLAVVTNIDYEHMDYYGTWKPCAVRGFINKILLWLAVLCLDDEEIQGISPACGRGASPMG